jgi:hypothetical protein
MLPSPFKIPYIDNVLLIKQYISSSEITQREITHE